MDNYFTSQLPQIFRSVAVLIYVFDVSSPQRETDVAYYTQCLDAIRRHSPDAKLYCLVHKMDLVAAHEKEARFAQRERDLLARSAPLDIHVYGTSIFEDSLYRAWSDIIHAMVPDVRRLEKDLEKFRRACEAIEVVLFERTTFLVIATATQKTKKKKRKEETGKVAKEVNAIASQIEVKPNGLHSTVPAVAEFKPPSEPYRPMQKQRYEKISTIIKQFRHSCSQKMQTSFQQMEIHRPTFSAYMDALTLNTYVMVIINDTSIQSAATRMNISMARAHFEQLEKESALTESRAADGS